MSASPARPLASLIRVLWAALRPAPESLTLDQLRSDLSHETAAKIARLSGLVVEWREGRFRPADIGDAEAILSALDRLCLRHARLALASFASCARLVGLVDRIGTVRQEVQRMRAGESPSPATVRLTSGLDDLRGYARALVEALSARHGTRFAALVSAAADEVGREAGAGEPGSVPVVLEGMAEAPAIWVPRRDAVLWSDIVRNLVRNAVQATEERPRLPAAGPGPLPGVTLRLLPLTGKPGAALEVVDEGIGMCPATVAAMWRAGQSRHGTHHGQGLTESKRAFIESRASLEVRSAEGVGTCVRIDLPHRDVRIRTPRVWALPPIDIPLAAVLVAILLALAFLAQREVVTVETSNRVVARGMDARGWLVWQQNLGEAVLPNYLGNPVTELSFVAPPNEFLVLRGPDVAQRGAVLATAPAQGPGRVWRLDGRGRPRWVRTLRWIPPRGSHAGSLRSDFEVLTPWNEQGRGAIALNVRDADWGSTSIQFVTADGESLGAYYHPGPLAYFHCGDVDGDGKAELVLMGKAGWSDGEPGLLPARAAEAPLTLSCLVMLRPPQVNGQAFPYARWAGVPPAREEAYLVIPPLRWNTDASIRDLRLGAPTAPGRAEIELLVADGRIYRLDARLRPLSCAVGERGPAAALAPTRALAPLVYIREGRRESIDLPIRREP